MSADPCIFIEKCVISAIKAFVVANVENGGVSWTIYTYISGCIIVGGLFGASYQTLLHSFVVDLIRQSTVIAVEQNILVACVCYKSLFLEFALTVLRVEFQSSWTVLALKSFKVEIHWISTGYACISVEVRCDCWAGEKRWVEIWDLIHEVSCSLEVVIPAC